jgi:carbamate kinase
MPEAGAPPTLVALGGNVLLAPEGNGSLPEQARALRAALAVVVELARRGERALVTHGNGPQVGAILARVEAAHGAAYDLPLDACVAQSQGELGYLISQVLESLLRDAGLEREVACVLTRVAVDADDPAMRSPRKPIGPVLDEAQAAALRARGATIVEEPGRGLRRAVPSPWPQAVLELEAIGALLARGTVVIAAGGGGIPVARRADGALAGVEAVVDKDLTSAWLAAELGAARLLNLTAVGHAQLDFGTPQARDLTRLTVAEARRYLAAGHFAAGSMGPKIEGAIYFLERGGGEVVITTPAEALAALDGRRGTRIVRE